jgi:hypothetical protein
LGSSVFAAMAPSDVAFKGPAPLAQLHDLSNRQDSTGRNQGQTLGKRKD